nr:MAG TPA: Baseplate J like protein [Caudoviricetes sp.]
MKDYYEKTLGGSVSDVEGTFIGDALAAAAVEDETTSAEMQLIVEAAFAQTSWGEYLTMRAAEFGIDRKLAVNAVGTVTVTGSGSVPLNSLFATQDGIQFMTTKAVAINGSGDIPVEAVVAGSQGNVAAGMIVKIPISIAGITAVTNSNAMTEGYDEETDDALKERLLFHVRNPITSGNVNHYQEWAESVEGVGVAKVIPLWNGNGTVKVLIINDEKDRASDALIKKTADYIETVRPIGATVTVATPDYAKIDISARVSPATGHEDSYLDELKTAINNYLVDYGFTSEYVDATYISMAQIGEVMIHSGAITDYDSLKANGDIVNISLTSEQLPRIGNLEVTELE